MNNQKISKILLGVAISVTAVTVFFFVWALLKFAGVVE